MFLPLANAELIVRKMSEETMRFRRFVIVALMLFVILCWMLPASAQTNTNCEVWITINMPPPDGFYCPPEAHT